MNEAKIRPPVFAWSLAATGRTGSVTNKGSQKIPTQGMAHVSYSDCFLVFTRRSAVAERSAATGQALSDGLERGDACRNVLRSQRADLLRRVRPTWTGFKAKLEFGARMAIDLATERMRRADGPVAPVAGYARAGRSRAILAHDEGPHRRLRKVFVALAARF